MSNEPTEKQKRVYMFIRNFTSDRGYPPTVREIAAGFHIAVSSAFDHLLALERKGRIRRSPRRRRTLAAVEPTRPETVAVPILGRIRAGEPDLAAEHREEVIFLPADFAGKDVFALRVKGDSMTGAGIADGDLVLVRKQAAAENGDIVVALLGEEATVKRLVKKGGGILLCPENKNYSPISLTEETRIVGRVVWLLRRY